jgi:mRNA interferase MazF
VLPFPFSDLTQSKRRPSLVLADLDGDDIILCQITSQASRDRYSIPITDADFAEGALRQPSNVRPTRIFTADSHIVAYKAGRLEPAKLEEILNAVVQVIRG